MIVGGDSQRPQGVVPSYIDASKLLVHGLMRTQLPDQVVMHQLDQMIGTR